ncbi:MAG TPA: hypothetical protein ENH32_07565 [Proteobacteria bacterium]|nr:hypothetical protein [Pseudomonadota bacterium]
MDHHIGSRSSEKKRPWRVCFTSAGLTVKDLVEHDAEERWQTQLKTAREAISQADVAPSDIAAIGITNQRETF